MRRIVLAACALLSIPLAAPAQNFNYQSDVGYTRLKSEQGAATPTGSDQKVVQVEASADNTNTQTYFPDTSNPQFSGKTITAHGPTPTIVSGHATTVGEFFYGNTSSMSPGIPSIDVFEANAWINNFLHAGSALGPTGPDASNYTRVTNHSWVGSASSGSSADADILRRADFVAASYDMIQVVGLNEPGTGLSGPQPLLASSYNAIAVGETNGTAISGTAAVDSFYTAGRAKPDLVAPQDATSWATPTVASAAALLVNLGHENPLLSKGSHFQPGTSFLVQNAETTPVIKAALMAGADRVTHNTGIAQNITDYRSAGNQTSNGLDSRYGAGQLDVYNSYHIIAAGQQTPGAISSFGFDYNGAFANTQTASYTFTGDTGATASLVWNAHITPGAGGDFLTATPTLANFDLFLYKLGGPSPTLISSSTSTIDNTENVYVSNLDPTGIYELMVQRADSLGPWEYGLAWDLTPAPEPTSLALVALSAMGLLLRPRGRRVV